MTPPVIDRRYSGRCEVRKHLVRLALTDTELEILAVAVGMANDEHSHGGDVWEDHYAEPAKRLEKKLDRLRREEK